MVESASRQGTARPGGRQRTRRVLPKPNRNTNKAISTTITVITCSVCAAPVLVGNSVVGSGLDFHAVGRYSLSSPPRDCGRRILLIRAGDGIMFGSSSGACRSIPSPWWLRPAL
jgi:hypothetical protein